MQEPRNEAKRASPQPADPAGGSPPAMFEEAYVRYAPRLRRVAMGKFGIAPEDAEGLAQDVFATFFMHAASVRRSRAVPDRRDLQRGPQAPAAQGAAEEIFCGESPCVATTGDVLCQIERKQLLSIVFARIGSRCQGSFAGTTCAARTPPRSRTRSSRRPARSQ
jgi:hypothetical protein